MAVTQTIIKNTHQEAIVKVSGTSASSTIDISALLAQNQVLSGSTVRVDIVGAVVTGMLGSGITIVRNSIPVLSFSPENNGKFNFEGEGFRDTVENDQDIVVTVSGAEAQIYLILRKVSGFASTIEYATFGSYDNPNAAGS